MRPVLILLLAGCVIAIPKTAKAFDHDDRDERHDNGKHWGHRDRDDEDRDRHRRYRDACFRDEHLRVIHDYYWRDYHAHRHAPPAVIYYSAAELPAGWERRVRPFPVEVERQLPPPPPDCARGYIDGYAVVYQPRTHLVIDFHAVF